MEALVSEHVIPDIARMVTFYARNPCYFRVLNKVFPLSEEEEYEHRVRKVAIPLPLIMQYPVEQDQEGLVTIHDPIRHELLHLPPFAGVHVVNWNKMEVMIYPLGTV